MYRESVFILNSRYDVGLQTACMVSVFSIAASHQHAFLLLLNVDEVTIISLCKTRRTISFELKFGLWLVDPWKHFTRADPDIKIFSGFTTNSFASEGQRLCLTYNVGPCWGASHLVTESKVSEAGVCRLILWTIWWLLSTPGFSYEICNPKCETKV